MKSVNFDKVTALLLVPAFLVGSQALTIPPKETTTSSSGSQFKIFNGPWGNNQTKNVHMQCDIYIPEDMDPGILLVSISIDRSTTNVEPHTLVLVESLPGGLNFTFSNTWVIPTGNFIFDFELSYDIAGGDSSIPGGSCYVGKVSESTTKSSTTPVDTTETSTQITTSETTNVITSTTQSTAEMVTSFTAITTTITPEITPTAPETTESSSTATPMIATTSQTVATTMFGATSGEFTTTTILPTTETTTQPQATTASPQTTGTTVTSTRTLGSTSLRATSATGTPSNSNDGDTSKGNIFTSLRRGDKLSIIFVSSLLIAVLILLGLLRYCLYRCLCRRNAVSSKESAAAEKRKHNLQSPRIEKRKHNL